MISLAVRVMVLAIMSSPWLMRTSLASSSSTTLWPCSETMTRTPAPFGSGRWALAHQAPDQMGASRLPASNSIQTPEPTLGSSTMPWPSPAKGAAGIAQPQGCSPSTAGTVARMRHWSLGSPMSVTMPRYLP
ncbi:hypothetical protein D9M68_505100 [compost metagenome]